MAQKQKAFLDHLQLAAGKHAIQEVAFTLHLDKDISLEKAKHFQALHKGQFKKDFPKFSEVIQNEFHFSNSGIKNVASKESGFSFEQYQLTGKIKYRLIGQRNPDGTSWVAVNVLDYSRWNPVSAMTYEWLRKVIAKQKKLNAIAITLQYIDSLNWNSSEKLPYEDIFNLNTIYLPSKISGNATTWQSNLAYNEQKNGYNQVYSLSVSVLPLAPNTGYRIVIDNPLTISFEKPVNINQAIQEKGALIGHFQTLHNENKKILKDILAPDVCKKMGLN